MNTRRRQQGFSLVSAIFLVVVVAMIAGYALSIGSTTVSATSLALQGKRAEGAARSGLEWVIARILQDNACPASSSTLTPAGTGISGFTVSISCSSVTVTEGATTYPIYSVDVTATTVTGELVYARRRLSAQVSGI
jgi:MSHA biogenesis protein MshP